MLRCGEAVRYGWYALEHPVDESVIADNNLWVCCDSAAATEPLPDWVAVGHVDSCCVCRVLRNLRLVAAVLPEVMETRGRCVAFTLARYVARMELVLLLW